MIYTINSIHVAGEAAENEINDLYKSTRNKINELRNGDDFNAIEIENYLNSIKYEVKQIRDVFMEQKSDILFFLNTVADSLVFSSFNKIVPLLAEVNENSFNERADFKQKS